LLGEGLALAEVAYQLGFADQSHFQRVFKAHVGVTPGQYRDVRSPCDLGGALRPDRDARPLPH